MKFPWSQPKGRLYPQPAVKASRFGKRSPLIVFVVILGLAVTAFSARVLLNMAASRQVLSPVVVPTHNILPYSVITEKDVTVRMVPAGGVGEKVAQSLKEVVGGVAAAPLYANEQIRKERIVPPGKVESDRCVVGVNVNLTRAVGGDIRPGDLVDVYWLYSDVNPGGLIATDAQVLDVRDAQGNPLNDWGPQQSTITQTVGAVANPVKLPTVAVLAVRPNEVSRVVTGAHTKSEAIVLVKKLSPAKEGVTDGNAGVALDKGQSQGN